MRWGGGCCFVGQVLSYIENILISNADENSLASSLKVIVFNIIKLKHYIKLTDVLDKCVIIKLNEQ